MSWITIGVIVAVIAYVVFAYNGLVALRQRTNQSFADVDVQLKQRHDLVPNLVETVKGYAAHEADTFREVVEARNRALGAQAAGDKAAAEQQLSGALGRLLALSEAYPDLKASANFQQLQAELANVENNLAAARRFFNNTVSEYNASLQSIPTVFFARPLGFAERDYFDVGVETRAKLDVPPSLSFKA